MIRGTQLSLFKALVTAFILALPILAGAPFGREDAMAQEEVPGKLIETFVLTPDSPARVFFDGKLKVELIGVKSDEIVKTITIRISSRALKAEYGDEWREHTYLEMLKWYVGSPISGSPFKCAEGWLYYEKSENKGVILSLRANPHMSGASSYTLLLLLLENWRKLFIGLFLIGLAIFLYYYIPLFWSFVSIQYMAHAHAQQTGFPSSPLLIYLVKRLPLLLAFYLIFHCFFSYGWKGVAGAVAIAVSLQLYFNWYNAQQLRHYASIRSFTAIPGSKERAFQGQVRGRSVALAVGGTFISNPYYAGDYSSGGPGFHMSFLVMEVMLPDPHWDGLVLTRDPNHPRDWSASRPLDSLPGVRNALAEVSRLPKYSILQLEVKNNKLVTVKMFAPDTPAEINLLADLVTGVAQALEASRPSLPGIP